MKGPQLFFPQALGWQWGYYVLELQHAPHGLYLCLQVGSGKVGMFTSA